MLFHLYENSLAIADPASFNKVSMEIRNNPLIFFLEVFVIYLPLLYHTIYGLYIMAYSRQNAIGYSYYRNWAFLWQRATGIITLVFLLYHQLTLRFGAFANQPANYIGVMSFLSDTWIYSFYIIGLIAVSYHFTNGLWAFLVSWGFTVGPRAQKISAIVCGLLFVAVAYLGVAIATHYYLAGNGITGTFLS
jgi:succinate dehydrogenase / fumarate reductase cytochrome b subunit